MPNRKKSIITTVIILTLGLTTINAGSDHPQSYKGHSHSPHFDKVKPGITKETVEKAAKMEILRLVVEKKIHNSWKSVPISKIGKTHYGDTDDWVVAFDNMKIKSKKRRTLYIFVSVGGEIRGANYTGN